MVAHIGVDGIGKIQYSGTFGKLEQVPLRGEHENFIFIQIHFELVHELEVVVVLQRAAYVVEPFVHSAFSAFNTFVSPMRGQSSFGYFVHSFGSDLHFHPFVLRPEDRDMQAFVTVAFGDGQPIPQPFGVGLIHVRDDGINLPAFHLFFFEGGIQNDADGKQVVNAFHSAMLLLHLLPDGVYAFGTPFHVEFQTGLLQLFVDRSDELFDIFVTRFFSGVQFFFN